MKNRIKEKLAFAVLSFLILVTAGLPFLSVYDLAQENTLFFVGMLALISCLTLLIKKHIIIFPLYILSYLFTLYHYFPAGQSFGITWFASFIQKLLQSYPKMLSGEINYLPDFFALPIILFLLIILNSLFIRYERWIMGYLLLISYLLMLAVFNHLNLGIQVILITAFAILFYGLKHAPPTASKKEKRTLFLSSGLILFLVAGSSFLLPMVFPQAQNFLFTQTAPIRNYMNHQGIYRQIADYGSSTASRTGFSQNDAQLGGPISDDQTILFTAKQTSGHYWRVETKNYFTGKGWKNTSEVVSVSDEQPLSISTNPEYQGHLGADTTITLSFMEATEYLPYPYGNISIPFNEIGRTEQIKEKERINLVTPSEKINLTWTKPSFTQEEMQQVPYAISQDIQMTQVPMTTPERVQKLAVSLTENQETLLGKVKAIERYLKQEGNYRYSKIDTPFTPPNEDYVDHFLFESKIGYCDNFSSAMILLLRSIGIPSRWAKGFSSGSITSNKDAEYQEYTIKNSDAHSWPEVYFQGYGWIPFEPTPGFTNDIRQSTATSNSTSESKPVNNSSESLLTAETKETTEAASTTTESSTKEDNQNSVLIKWLPVLPKIAFALAIILLAVFSFLLKRYFFLLHFRLYLSLYPDRFTHAYSIILRKSERILCRQTNETLTIYAKRFEKDYPQFHGSFIQLTELYECTFYGGIQPKKADYAGLLMHTARLLTNLKRNTYSKKEPKQN
ncbi:hypothetical protein A5821_001922 [Enterococcus sp. 7F3_DIV0205]|uniref:Transglutaminase-like domain-containing protein n=1 Tax=Candidatus Enterococcus palustris TaxID=1834189 RepID=A0AAQ3WB22_9ENTE|nr:transglutaminase domain-containing protein [Enterococcus sp. 7F3_DIV0205]OTN82358.1 hypothetical protein A5821_002269 [Enterococcus sp. 7F3_DIV0205]